MRIAYCINNVRLQTHKHKNTPTKHLLHILVVLQQRLRERGSVLSSTEYLQL